VATTHIAKGTAASSTFGSTLVISGVTAKPGSFLVASVGYVNDEGPPIATWGNSNMRRIALEPVPGTNRAVAIFAKLDTKVSITKAKDVLFSWEDANGDPTSIGSRAAVVTAYEGVNNPDEDPQTRKENNTTAPNTGLPAAPSILGVLKYAAFCSNGPITDVQGIPTGATSIGQRAGTDSGGEDVTIEEYFDLDRQNLDAVQTIVNGTALRDWVMAQIYVRPSEGVIGGLDASGGTIVLSALEMGDVKRDVLAWANIIANQTTAAGFIPVIGNNLTIAAKMRLMGIALTRMSGEVV